MGQPWQRRLAAEAVADVAAVVAETAVVVAAAMATAVAAAVGWLIMCGKCQVTCNHSRNK